jgi:outer membrane cobalamin receptor
MCRLSNPRIILFLFFSFSTYFLNAQDLDSLMNMSALTEESELQKNLNKGLTVSSSKALPVRETPGIISLITAEEIRNMGARDLSDVLRLVPGFDVAQDLQFVIGLGLRGNWANEGKILVMLDGQPLNDLLYQTVAIGNRFPVDAIEQIEIIRGPGSAIYGGSAEYGVINIKTKAAESLDGVIVHGTGGFHTNAVGRTNGGIMVAKKGENVSWDLSFFKGNGIISDKNDFEVLTQDSVPQDLSKTTYADPMNINVGLKVKGFQLRAMYDEFKTREPFTFVSFKHFYVDAKHEWKISKNFTLTPQIRYFNQLPWAYGDPATNEYSLKARAERYFGTLSGSYDFSRKVNLNFGVVYFKDKAEDLLRGDYFLGKNAIEFNNVAVFAQGLLKHRLVNATLGFRYERNNQYGSAFVPRIALTKKIQNFHFKVLYSQAFRAPAIENINLAVGGGGNIKPEKSNVFELEFGYQFTPEMLLSVNAFNILTNETIVYGSEIEEGTYQNYPESGSRGFELLYSIRKNGWYANLTYSYSKAITGDSVVQTYIVPQSANQYVGFPIHKVTLNTNINLTPKLTFNPTFIYASKRYAYTSVDANDEAVSNKLDPYVLVNAFFNYRDVLPGFTAGFGVYDLLNEKPVIPQAYNGGYAPIPGRSREYVLKISYQLNFKK